MAFKTLVLTIVFAAAVHGAVISAPVAIAPYASSYTAHVAHHSVAAPVVSAPVAPLVAAPAAPLIAAPAASLVAAPASPLVAAPLAAHVAAPLVSPAVVPPFVPQTSVLLK